MITYKETTKFLTNLNKGDYVMVLDVDENMIYPVVTWEIRPFAVEIETNPAWYIVEHDDHVSDNFTLFKACNTMKIMWGVN